MLDLRNRKHFQRFHTVVETRVEVWENDKIEVGTRARKASVSMFFRVLPNFQEYFYNVWGHENINGFYFETLSPEIRTQKVSGSIPVWGQKHLSDKSLSSKQFSFHLSIRFNIVERPVFKRDPQPLTYAALGATCNGRRFKL